MPASLEQIQDKIAALTAVLLPKIEQQQEEIRKYGTASEDVAKKVFDFGAQLATLQQAIASIEANGSQAAKGSGNVFGKSVGERFSESEAYKMFRTAQGDRRESAPVKIGSFWERKLAGAPEIDPTSAGSLIVPWYRHGIIELAKPMPIIRSFATVLPTSETNSIKTDREVEDRGLAAQLTANANSGSSSFVVDNVNGFSTTAPFNTLTLDNGTTTESLTIDTITASTLTITTTTTSSIAMLAGDVVWGANFVPTPEGYLAPKAYTIFEDYTIPICDLCSLVKVTLDKLRDVAGLEDIINRRSLDRCARMEDVNAFYGPGGTGLITGIFTDSDVSALTWSAQAEGTNIFDFLCIAYFALANASYAADGVVVNPDVMRQLVTMKASDGHYLYLQNNLTSASPSSVLAVPIKWSAHLQSTHGVIANWKMATTVYDREASEVSIGTVDDDFAKRKRSILAVDRVGFGIELPGAMRRLVFDAAP